MTGEKAEGAFHTLIEEAARLSINLFVNDTFLGFCEGGRKVPEEVKGIPGAWPIPQAVLGIFRLSRWLGLISEKGDPTVCIPHHLPHWR